jgi:hypothetical protein
LENPTADSLRLLGVAYDYLTGLVRTPVSGVCVFSSVAWGTATPVSDIDVGFVVPDGTDCESGKREFQGEFIDHCEWPWSWVETAIEDPLRNHILSYSLANAIMLFDLDDRLAEARRRLECAVMRPPGALEWMDYYLNMAARMREKAWEAYREDPEADISGFLFTGVRRYADAVLHRHPGGHCGEWPERLREYALATRNGWLYDLAASIIAPGKIEVSELAAAIDPLEELHVTCSDEPRGTSLGCSGPSGKYFARKARYYAGLGDFLSLLHVLRKQVGYVRENIDAKADAGGGGEDGSASDLLRVDGMMKTAWPAQAERNEERLEALGEYGDRLVSYCEKTSRRDG